MKLKDNDMDFLTDYGYDYGLVMIWIHFGLPTDHGLPKDIENEYRTIDLLHNGGYFVTNIII